jgi:hypothetical protein
VIEHYDVEQLCRIVKAATGSDHVIMILRKNIKGKGIQTKCTSGGGTSALEAADIMRVAISSAIKQLHKDAAEQNKEGQS